MNWRNLYPGIEALCRYPGYLLVCMTTASATIGVLYLKQPFEHYFQYLPALAGVLYFIGRAAFIAYYRLSVNVNEVIAYSFIASTAFALLGQYTLGMDAIDQDDISSYSYTVAMLGFNVSYFFAGAACSHVRFGKSNLIAIAMVLLVVVPLLFALDGELFLNYYEMRKVTGNDDFSHLYISEWCVFFFIGAYGFAKPALRPVIIVVAFLALFSLTGRASTLFTLVTFIIYSFLTYGRKTIYIMIGMGLLAALAYVYTPAPVEDVVVDVLAEANQKELQDMLLSGDDQDSSLEGRSEIFMFSVSHLPKSILFGDPTFLALEAKRMGSYIHNLLSMWQFFGLLPFLLMVVILFRSLRQMWTKISERNMSVMEEIACMLLIYAFISVMAAKSIVFYWLWFSTGYWMLRYSVDTHGGDSELKVPLQRKRTGRRRTIPRRFSF